MNLAASPRTSVSPTASERIFTNQICRFFPPRNIKIVLARVGNRSDCVGNIPLYRSDWQISVSESSRDRSRILNAGFYLVWYDPDRLLGWNSPIPTEIYVGYPRFGRLWLVKWETALFKLNWCSSRYKFLKNKCEVDYAASKSSNYWR